MRAFLLSLDEFEQMFHKVERRLRDARVVEVLGNAELHVDYKVDFQDKENMEPLVAAVRPRRCRRRWWRTRSTRRGR